MDWTASTLRTDFRYVVVDRTTWGEVREVTDITGGSISRKYLSSLKEGASLNYSNTAQLLGIGNDYLRIYLDADDGNESESVALGTFMVSTPKQSVSDLGTSGTATAYSLLQIAQDEGLDGTLTIPAGTNLVQYAAQLLTDRGLQVNIADNPTETAANDTVFDTDNNILDVVIWCTQTSGFGTPLLDGYGTVVLQRYSDPSGRQPVRVYTDASKVMFPTYTHELDTFDYPNKVIAVCSTPDSVLIGTAVNSDPSHPYSTVSRGRVVTRKYDVDNITTQTEADEKAASLLASVSEVEAFEVSHLYDGSNLQDVIGILDRGNACIVNQDIKLEIGCPVTDRARRFVY